MGQGLGKNSPVQLSLGRENYEALLSRHGQWIRWRQAQKCPCVKGATFSPDIHCKLCGGRGYTYTYQPSQIVQTIVMAMDETGLIELNSEFENDTLIKVYNYSGSEFSNAEKLGCYVNLNEDSEKGVYYYFVLERNNVSTGSNISLTKMNDNYFQAADLIVKKTNIDGVYYSAPCDILKAENIVDAEGNEFEVDQLRLNQILLKEKYETVTDEETGEKTLKIITPVEPLSAGSIEYIEPFIFALLNQNLNKGDQQALVESGGDAMATFPYSCDVAEQDVMTVLAGTITQKEVLAKTEDEFDVLPAYFVESIVSVIKSDGTELVNGTDYILIGANRIKFLDEDTMPDDGEGYSITFKVYPSYVVMENIPQLRSSENQRFPKKAIVKLLSSYSEQKKVNRQ